LVKLPPSAPPHGSLSYSGDTRVTRRPASFSRRSASAHWASPSPRLEPNPTYA
jgi:hypothetical protein